MKTIEHIIIVEDDEISLFISRNMLAPLEKNYSISYFTNVEETMDFLKKLPLASGSAVSLFVNISITLDNEEFTHLARKAILSTPFRLFLLAPMAVAGERKKQFENSGFLCCIEEPLTEQKFMQALNGTSPSIPL